MFFKTLPQKPRVNATNALYDIGISICILAACSIIGYVFYYFHLSEANIISIYIIGILVISSLTSNWIYGTTSSVCGVLLFNFLYADPKFNFHVYDIQYSITIVVMLISSLVTNSVMMVFRSKIDKELLEIKRLDILLETSQQLQKAQKIEDIFSVALEQFHNMFGCTTIILPIVDETIYEQMVKYSDADYNLKEKSIMINEQELKEFINSKSKSISVFINNQKKAICFKMKSVEEIFAITCIVVDNNKNIFGFEYNLILAMLDEISLSLEKLNLHLFNEKIAREADAERLRTNLLRTISHDLRTPLTSISGTADILLSKGDQIKPDLRQELYQNIYNDSEWLINLVENLLFVTRIDHGLMSINTEYEVLQEIIQEALNHMAKRSKEHTISLEIPEELLIVKIDARLIMQVLINLLDNAIKYSPQGSDIKVKACQHDEKVTVEIADAGCGISDANKEKVFEMFYTTNKQASDSRRGIGLGLPLCRSIVHAHGGIIYVSDNTPQGSVVNFILPLEEVCVEREYIGN